MAAAAPLGCYTPPGLVVVVERGIPLVTGGERGRALFSLKDLCSALPNLDGDTNSSSTSERTRNDDGGGGDGECVSSSSPKKRFFLALVAALFWHRSAEDYIKKGDSETATAEEREREKDRLLVISVVVDVVVVVNVSPCSQFLDSKKS